MAAIYRCPKEIDKDSLLQATEEQCCRVCQRPLSIPPSGKCNNLSEKGKKLGQAKPDLKKLPSDKQRAENELIVSAMCGHLFHKFCLRHYCYTYRQGGANDTLENSVECPVCFQFINMTKVQMIDFKVHQKGTSGYDKAYRHASILNKELSGQKEISLKALSTVENCTEEAGMKLLTYRSHEMTIEEKIQKMMSSKYNNDKIFEEIKEASGAIDMLHRENMHLIAMYLSIMKDKTPTELKNKGVPTALIPYLAMIQGNDKLMRKFGEILKPVEINGLRSNKEILIKQILAEVQSKGEEEDRRNTIQVANLPKHFKLKRDQANPVVVKVQNSSLSIFSRSVLTEESLQLIMKKVQAPVKALKDAHKRCNQTLIPLQRSNSEIKVLFEPRKRQTESESTPNRLPYFDSDCEFGGKEFLPLRNCKSTEPILMKNYVKGPKALIVKIDDLKQNAIQGDSNDGKGYNRNDIAFSSRGCRGDNEGLISFPTTPRDSGVGNKPVDEVESVQIRELNGTPCFNDLSLEKIFDNRSRTQPKSQIIEQEKSNIDAKSSGGFSTNVKASVLELLLENIIEDEKLPPSLVDEVSKRTFGKFTKPSYHFGDELTEHKSTNNNGLVEYKINANGEVQPFVTDKQLNVEDNADSDIESGIKLCELLPQPYSEILPAGNNNNVIGQQCFQDTGSVFTGILPGPYRNPIRCGSNCKPPLMYDTGSKGNDSLPLYLTNWVSKLPSAKMSAAGYITPVPSPAFPPPPPLSNTVQRVAHTFLPPLPKTPPPLQVSTVLKPSDTIENRRVRPFNRCSNNRSYEDRFIERNVSYARENVEEASCSRYTVIEIPGSNACIHRQQPSEQKISSKWSLYSTVGYSRTSLPPLPGEYNGLYTVKNSPVSPQKSQMLLVQPPPFHIVVHPKFSSPNVNRSRAERTPGWTLENQCQFNEPYQLQLRRLSQEPFIHQPESNLPNLTRDFNPAEGYRQRSWECFSNFKDSMDVIYTKPRVAFVENALSQLCQGLSPPVTPGLLRKDNLNPTDLPVGQDFVPSHGIQYVGGMELGENDINNNNGEVFRPHAQKHFGTWSNELQSSSLSNQIPSAQPRIVRRARRRHNLNV